MIFSLSRTTSVILLTLVISSILHADETALDHFNYQPERMDDGTQYTYRISNFEGDKSIVMEMYMSGDNRIEFFKDYSTMIDMVYHLTIDLNKEYFVFGNGLSVNPFSYLKQPRSNSHAYSSWDFENRRREATMVYYDRKGIEKEKTNVYNMSVLPSFDLSIYQFDFALAMRHFTGSREDELTVGGFYAGRFNRAIMSFEKEEEIDGVPCDKWVIAGRGLGASLVNYRQEFWFAKESDFYHLVQYKNHMEKISPFGNIHIELLNIEENVSPEQWAARVAELTEQARVRLGFPLATAE